MHRALLIVFCCIAAWQLPAEEVKLEPLPAPISNNVVASLKTDRMYLFSFMGIGPNKTWNEIRNSAYQLDMNSGKWIEIRPVPGPAGRLAASAVGLREQVFVFGGYVVDAQGREMTVPDVSVYEPIGRRWYRGPDIPVPVDDAAIGTYRERYIYLIGGWSTGNAVRNVQMLDVQKNIWRQATPLPGTPVFGHAGAVLGDTIVYVDGASKNPSGNQPRYVAVDECWMGKIDRHDVTKIQWSKMASHPGQARYRIAGGASVRDHKIYFSGGTDIPYNYNGVGYDGRPAEPSPITFAWDLRSGKWEVINENTPDPTMDHRGLIVGPEGLIIIGGMEKGQHVTARVAVIPTAARKR